MPEIPDRLALALADRYRLERQLGQGGMATVYLAEDLKHDRKVAVKVLRPELAAVLGAERFVVEIKTTAALQHPHILPLFDSGSADGFLYYVMPYIEGETLRSRLDRDKQLGIEEAVRITREVADALDYAHRHGVIHRDIKPENILLHDGRPMVADFGIALAVSAAAGGRMTETGLSLGTPHYMSPEQATADRDLTARSDVYSLASVLYEMVAGDPPHTGASAQQIIMKIIAEEVQPVTRHRKAVPPNVAAALATALEKLPADRFATARAFADALANPAYRTTDPGGASPSAAAGRHLRLVEAAALAVLGIGAGALGVRQLAGPRAAVGGLERQQLTFEGLAGAPGISPDGKRVAYLRRVCRHAGIYRCRAALLVQDVGATRATRLLDAVAASDAPHWTADGQALLVNASLDSARTGLFLIPLATGTPRLLLPGRGANGLHPTADSAVFVTSLTRTSSLLRILDLKTGAVADSFTIGFGAVTSIDWSPDGRWFALVARREGQVPGLSLVGRHGEQGSSSPERLRSVARWAPDGRSVIVFRTGIAREDELIRVPASRDGTLAAQGEVVLPRVATLYSGRFDVARRSGALALGLGDAVQDVHLVDLTRTPATARRLAAGTTWYGSASFTPDDAGIFFMQGDAVGDNIYRLDFATGEQEALTAQDRTGDLDLRVAADGRRLSSARQVSGDMRLDIMELPSGQVRSAMAGMGVRDVLPLGATALAAAREDGALLVADSLGGPWVPVPLGDTILVASVDASGDGRRLAVIAQLHDRWVVLLTDPAGRDPRVLLTLAAEEPAPGLSWTRGDVLYLVRWPEEDDAASIWRGLATGGGFTRVATVPVPCRPAETRVSNDGRRAVCIVSDFRGDIWIYRVPAL